MAVNHLIGKQRFTSRSDREREKLQAQISGYALRFHADADAEQRRVFERRIQAEEPPVVAKQRNLEDWISSVMHLVDRHFPCSSCGQTGSHTITCSELATTLGVAR